MAPDTMVQAVAANCMAPHASHLPERITRLEQQPLHKGLADDRANLGVSARQESNHSCCCCIHIRDVTQEDAAGLDK